MARGDLYMEERVAIARRMLNEQSVPLKTHKQWIALVRRCMWVLEGARFAVPRNMRTMARPVRRKPKDPVQAGRDDHFM